MVELNYHRWTCLPNLVLPVLAIHHKGYPRLANLAYDEKLGKYIATATKKMSLTYSSLMISLNSSSGAGTFIVPFWVQRTKFLGVSRAQDLPGSSTTHRNDTNCISGGSCWPIMAHQNIYARLRTDVEEERKQRE